MSVDCQSRSQLTQARQIGQKPRSLEYVRASLPRTPTAGNEPCSDGKCLIFTSETSASRCVLETCLRTAIAFYDRVPWSPQFSARNEVVLRDPSWDPGVVASVGGVLKVLPQGIRIIRNAAAASSAKVHGPNAFNVRRLRGVLGSTSLTTFCAIARCDLQYLSW